MIKLENIDVCFGDFKALKNINIHVKEGEFFTFLGPSGCGKTTTLRTITGFINPVNGTVSVRGKDITNTPVEKRNIGMVFQSYALFPTMTVYENIDYFCGLYVKEKEKRKSLVKEAIAFVGLEDYQKTRPKKLSGGLLRRLNIACGIAHKPRLIILDEPTVAVDPQSRNRILEGIQELNRQGATIVYTSHYMEEVEQICSRIAIMDHGRSIAVGTKEQLTGMIKTGEKVTIEAVVLSEEQLAGIRELPHVFAVDYQNDILTVQCTKARHNLVRILHCLEEQGTAFGRVYSELPTLNDVFLEITGKQLRD